MATCTFATNGVNDLSFTVHCSFLFVCYFVVSVATFCLSVCLYDHLREIRSRTALSLFHFSLFAFFSFRFSMRLFSEGVDFTVHKIAMSVKTKSSLCFSFYPIYLKENFVVFQIVYKIGICTDADFC